MQDDEKAELEARANDAITTLKAQRDSALDGCMQLEMMCKALQRDIARKDAKIKALEDEIEAAQDAAKPIQDNTPVSNGHDYSNDHSLVASPP